MNTTIKHMDNGEVHIRVQLEPYRNKHRNPKLKREVFGKEQLIEQLKSLDIVLYNPLHIPEKLDNKFGKLEGIFIIREMTKKEPVFEAPPKRTWGEKASTVTEKTLDNPPEPVVSLPRKKKRRRRKKS